MEIRELALDFLGRGGKRLRPRLCKAVFDSAGGRGDIAGVCEAVECFHKASLIHDDIQDCDEERYGRPSIWKEHGVAVAIAVGDWLVARGYQLIAHSSFDAALAMMSATVDSHRRLCEGQGDELLSRAGGVGSPAPFVAPGRPLDAAAYVSICERKTGEAFALAAQLGALAAGAKDAKYRRFGLVYGILFQINDDLADGAQEPYLAELKVKYENETAVAGLKCALGVW